MSNDQIRELDKSDEMWLSQLKHLDSTLSALSAQALEMRNAFLQKNGWSIEKHKIGPTDTFFYRKYGELFICEHEAIDFELRGT